ncbi:hypothetical protein HanRHA438_Chr01g0005841 [Helianthus annuus]|nr:hypothetical protein HanRHA438_Chr01g0005841 [Helianthus annuus]
MVNNFRPPSSMSPFSDQPSDNCYLQQLTSPLSVLLASQPKATFFTSCSPETSYSS